MIQLARNGFTLIELLVVITIIVVLLAMLTPALDKAIYQAELTVCAAQLKSIATSSQTYTVTHRRRYPYRRAALSPHGIALANDPFYTEAYEQGTTYADDRPVLREAFAMKYLLCPLADSPVDFDLDEPGESNIYTSYRLYYWYLIKSDNGVSASHMKKLGDRWSWDGQRYTILAADEDNIRLNNTQIYASHPDKDGVMSLLWQQAGGIPGALVFTQSEWFFAGTYRGPIDTNYAFTDGSIERYIDVEWNETHDTSEPGRFDRVPHTVNEVPPDEGDGNWNHAPRK